MNATALPNFLESLLESRRVDPDFNPSEADIEMVAKLLARAATIPGTFGTPENGKFQKWILAVLSLLVAGGVGGVIIMYGQLSGMRAEMTAMHEEIRELKAVHAGIK